MEVFPASAGVFLNEAAFMSIGFCLPRLGGGVSGMAIFIES